MPNTTAQKNKQSKSRKSKSPLTTNINKKSNKPSKTDPNKKDDKTQTTDNESNQDKTVQSSVRVETIGPNRFQVLSYEQVKYLHRLITETITIHPKYGSDFTPIKLSLRSFVETMRTNMKQCGIEVKDVRLSNTSASRVLSLEKVNYTSTEASSTISNTDKGTKNTAVGTSTDLDLIFTINIPDRSTFQKLKSTLFQLFISLINKDKKIGKKKQKDKKNNDNSDNSNESHSNHISYDQFNQEYVQKMARVMRTNTSISIDEDSNTSPTVSNSSSVILSGPASPLPYSWASDCWSTISVGHNVNRETSDSNQENNKADCFILNIWFIDRMRRQYEFTVDSFQVVLDTILNFYSVTGSNQITQTLFPTVVVESVSGSYLDAYRHLRERVIFTKNPEEICGGGLLKYCHLLMQGYKQDPLLNTKITEKYMCSRFFIDYPDIESQGNVILSYLDKVCINDQEAKSQYLGILFKVVSHSTVCLMAHERRQTFQLIQSLLNNIISDIEIRKSSIHLDEIHGSQRWMLDQVFFGTSYFPLQFYLTAPMMGDEQQSADPVGQSICQSDGAILICTGSGSGSGGSCNKQEQQSFSVTSSFTNTAKVSVNNHVVVAAAAAATSTTNDDQSANTKSQIPYLLNTTMVCGAS